MSNFFAKAFSTEGRQSRSTFFFSQIGIIFGYFLIGCLAGGLDLIPITENITLLIVKIVGGLIIFLGCIVCFIFSAVFFIKRIHDLNCRVNFWRVFLYAFFLPYFIYLFFAKGTAGPNKYGPDPLAIEETDEIKII